MTCGAVTYTVGAGLGSCGSMPAGTLGPRDGPVDPLPSIGNFTPSPGSAIGRLGYIQFDVTDDSDAFAAIFVNAVFPDGNVESVWDSDGFAPRYLAGSAVMLIDCGVHFVVRRAGGWYATPVRLDVFAIDVHGNRKSSKQSF